MKNAPEGMYDAVIVDSSDPIGNIIKAYLVNFATETEGCLLWNLKQILFHLLRSCTGTF